MVGGVAVLSLAAAACSSRGSDIATQNNQQNQATESTVAGSPPTTQVTQPVTSAQQSACTAAGGTITYAWTCQITFPDGRTGSPTFNPDGTVAAGPAAVNHDACNSALDAATNGRATGAPPWRNPPTWHPESGVCDPGTP
jgi:hypothetical protein